MENKYLLYIYNLIFNKVNFAYSYGKTKISKNTYIFLQGIIIFAKDNELISFEEWEDLFDVINMARVNFLNIACIRESFN